MLQLPATLRMSSTIYHLSNLYILCAAGKCQELADADALICRNNEMRIAACVDCKFTVELAITSFQHTIPAVGIICITLGQKSTIPLAEIRNNHVFSHKKTP